MKTFNGCIEIISLSSNINVIEKDNIERGIERLISLEFIPVFEKELVKNMPEIATEINNNILTGDQNNIVMSAIGGWVSLCNKDKLDYKAIKDNNKIFVGYSDTTIFNLILLSQWGMTSLYGPSFVTFCRYFLSKYTLDSFLSALNKDIHYVKAANETYDDNDWYLANKVYSPSDLGKNEYYVLNSRDFVGISVGGHLSTLRLLYGTELFPNRDDIVLFVEDGQTVNINKLKRDICWLKLISKELKIIALVIGRFSNIDVNKSMNNYIYDTFKDSEYPVISNVDFGHVEPMATIPIGKTCCYDECKNEFKFVMRG